MIVGLSGKKGSGKSTGARYMSEQHGYCVKAVATVLKEVSCLVFNFTKDQCYNPSMKEVIDPRWGVTPRKVMQVIGCELFRNSLMDALPDLKMEESTIWLTLLSREVKQLLKEGKNVVIEDIRFNDEAEFVHSLGGMIIQIDRNLGKNIEEEKT
jgi:hypothetical protein